MELTPFLEARGWLAMWNFLSNEYDYSIFCSGNFGLQRRNRALFCKEDITIAILQIVTSHGKLLVEPPGI
jgi:hypothetical protein